MAASPWIIILSVILLSSQVTSQKAVLHISNGVTDQEYCLVYNKTWTNLSQSLSGAIEYQLVNMSSSLLCTSGGVKNNTVQGKALVVMRGDCEFTQKALVAQELQAAALIIVSTTAMSTPSSNQSDYEKVRIPLVLMRYMDFQDAQEVFGEEMLVKLYAPLWPDFDASLAVMLLISVVTVALGAYWSGSCESVTVLGKSVSMRSVLLSAVCVTVSVIWGVYRNEDSVTVLGKSVSMRSVLLSAVCVTVSVIWGVYRNEDRWIWILQDLLGMAFCLNFLKTISLSNFKICVILLSLLLLYDVFFVFITPLFMPNGESIMVQVALGPDAAGEQTPGSVTVPAGPETHREKLPVVMRVPRISPWSQNLCGMQFSILGFGDIIIPGLLVAYCSRFDMRIKSPKNIYFFVCCIAYLCGMAVTFTVMLVTEMGQPALLYLVPFTLLASALLAWWRGEMRQFWEGTTYEVLDSTKEPLISGRTPDYASREGHC
ncbi:hypothetical protein UPYG_G00088550 [Umbra pygmaea]|uniref:PA domain-containing protein n=1 Tax=Umbra pygmaea TaxID=75934 RepID=A0ABD0XF90_UMBPY